MYFDLKIFEYTSLLRSEFIIKLLVYFYDNVSQALILSLGLMLSKPRKMPRIEAGQTSGKMLFYLVTEKAGPLLTS